MIIRPASKADLPAIRQIYASARQFMAKNGNPDQWGVAYPPEDMIRQDILNGKCYVNLRRMLYVGV